MATLGYWVDWARWQTQAHPVATAATLVLLAATTLALLWWHHPLYGQNVGPVAYPLVGTLPSFIRNSHRTLEYLTDEIRRTPTHTIRFVRPGGHIIYNTANVENVEHVLKTRFDNYPKGEFLSALLGDVLGKGIFNVDGDLWKLQRKLASHEFTSRSLREFGFECAERELGDRLLPFLHQACERRAVVDLQDLFLRFSFDNICQLGFGVDPKCLALELPTVRFAEAFDKAVECTVQRFRMLPMTRTVKQFLNLSPEREIKEAVAVVNEFAQEVIQQRRRELILENKVDPARQDLLSRFMRFTEHGDGVAQSELEQKCVHDLKLDAAEADVKERASDVFLRDIVISFVLAGRDTSSVGLSWLFHALSRNPRVEEKIYEEIRQHVEARGEAAVDPGRLFSFEELKQLQYLHAVIHESLRLFPPVPLDTKEALRDDVLPDGTVLRAGERITYNIYAMARMESIWGPDCEEFRPERWLKDGVFVPESSFKFATFQAGPRICLGKELALVQMKIVAASLIYHFKFTALDLDPPRQWRSLVFRMIHGFPATLRLRHHGSDQ